MNYFSTWLKSHHGDIHGSGQQHVRQCLSGSNSDALAHWDICQAVRAHGLELAYTHLLGTRMVLVCSVCAQLSSQVHTFKKVN